MKRFKTKQEFTKKDKVEHISLFSWMDVHGLFGLEEKHDPDRGYTSLTAFTTDPHPFDSMDIKVRVTPKQSKKLQEKAKAMGYQDEKDLFGSHYTDHGNDIILYIRQGKVTAWNPTTTTAQHRDHTELTYKQFINGTVPKKKEFKVGDWVEVVDDKNHEGLYCVHSIGLGEIHGITKISSEGNIRLGNYWVHKKNLKHTTKPKDHPITADEIIKPEVLERLKEVTILGIKACKSIKDVEEAYASLQNTIKEL